MERRRAHRPKWHMCSGQEGAEANPHPGRQQTAWPSKPNINHMRLSGLVNAVPGTPGLVRQRQAGQAAPATTGRRGCRHPLRDLERLKRAELHMERAIKEKIFLVLGSYPIIRSLLRARGWVERKLPGVGSKPEQQHGRQEKQLQVEEEEEEQQSAGAEQGEAVLDPAPESACCGAQPSLGTPEPLRSPRPPEEEEEELCDEDPNGIHDLMSCLVRNQVPYFMWMNRRDAVDCRLLRQDQVVNHYARVAAFTEGLCLSLRNLPWFDQDHPESFLPRCYRLGDADERQAFIGELGASATLSHPPGRCPSALPVPDCVGTMPPSLQTAARSLLKVALERAGDMPAGTEQHPKSVEGPAGLGAPLPPQLVEEALQVCKQHLGSLRHEDIDGDPPSPRMTSTAWHCFLRGYYSVVHQGAGLALSGAQQEQCRALLRCLGERLPQLDMESDHNVWILKPGAKSRGRGIVCMVQLEEVLWLAGGCTAPSAQANNWVVQKYVERPLLIFDTKFGVWQWFLMTDRNPLTVWFYRESYLRFCSCPFSLCRLDPTRHLCNVSIQKQYRPARGRHPQLPPDQIWSSRQLQAYLAQVGRADAWHQVMVPGMKAAVLGALRSAQDLVRSRKGSFELYGADFIFGEDCQPWLLEINTSPTMEPSSAVTSRLCARVQRDTLRVVIDRRDDPTCPTGAFELIYKETAMPMPPYLGLKLRVEGRSLTKPPPAQHQPQGQPRVAVPSAPQPSVATEVLQLGEVRGKLAPLERRGRCCPPSSTHPPSLQPPGGCARSQRLPQLSRPQGQPRAALPPLGVCPPARAPIPPPRGAPGGPQGSAGRHPSSSPARVLRVPRLAPNAGTLGTAVGRGHTAAPRGMQKSCGTEGHPGGNSTLPVLAGLTQRHPAPPHPSQTQLLGGGTQLTRCRRYKTQV
ncbi:tubulin tyrosine ligase 3-like [Leptosomus discolor]